MARVTKRGTLAEHTRRTTERIRKKEIEDVPGGAAASGFTPAYASVYMAAAGSGLTDVWGNRKIFPFDSIDEQDGISVDLAYSFFGQTGAALVFDDAGVYQFGLHGYFEITDNNLSGAPFTYARGGYLAALAVQGANLPSELYHYHNWLELPNGPAASATAMLAVPSYGIANAVSAPVAMNSGDAIWAGLPTGESSPNLSGLSIANAGRNDPLMLWARRVA